MQRSIVAGILDKEGNLNRMVVTYPEGLHFHVSIERGETSVTLPGLVQEPISDKSAYKLIARLEKRIKTRKARLVP